MVERDIMVIANSPFIISLKIVEKIIVENEKSVESKGNDYIFDIEWKEKPNLIEFDCDKIYIDKCGFYHTKTGESTTIKAYNSKNECIGILNFKV